MSPPTAVADLLTAIHTSLFTAIERQTSSLVKAMLAYLLSRTSQSYLRHLCESLGMTSSRARPFSASPQETSLDLNGDPGEQDGREHIRQVAQDDPFPPFLPALLKEALQAGQRSLQLLNEVQPDHHLVRASSDVLVSWFWSREAIESAWIGDPPFYPYETTSANSARSVRPPTHMHSYKPGLESLKMFDLEPGGNLEAAPNGDPISTAVTFLRQFIVEFPATLPSITPTLQDLTSLVFEPLVNRAGEISRELMSIFLSPDATPNLRLQLQLMRSYMLVCAPKFKSRLAMALFSDADEPNVHQSRNASALMQLMSTREDGVGVSHSKWPVGLSPGLSNGDTWPPNGADLSFFLRTAIVDAHEHDNTNSVDTRQPSSHNQFLREAELRLGFAIRDLSVEPGLDGWLNPCCKKHPSFVGLDTNAIFSD